MKPLRFPVLAADVGGTNARFSIIGPDGAVERLTSVRINEFQTPGEAVQHVLRDHQANMPQSAIFAYAGPVVMGAVLQLTNGDWKLDPESFLAETGLGSLTIMNDFVAQALAAISSRETELIQIGGGKREDNSPRVIVGPGTGLGVAIAIPVAERWVIVPGEGGHVDLGPRSPREFQLWPYLDTRSGRMEAELAVSGPGIENLHRAIIRQAGANCLLLSAAEITARAVAGSDPQCMEALDLMVAFLARICGDLAATTLARGGVYLAGGIVQHILPILRKGRFRLIFEDKNPLEGMMREVPIFAFEDSQSGLFGLESFVRNPDSCANGFVLEYSR